MSHPRWADGLLDLFVGTGLLLIGVVWLIPSLALFGGLAPLVLLPLWPIARAAVSRLGASNDTPSAPAWGSVLGRTLLLGVVAVLLGVGMYRIATRGAGVQEGWVGAVIPAFLGVLIGIGAVSMGLLLGLGRLLAYGVVIALLSAILTSAQVHAGVFLALSSGFVTATGAVLLKRYLAGPDPDRGTV